MYRDNATYKAFTRRALILAGGQLALFGVLAARMYQLQVLQSDRYKMLAEENRINLRLLSPPRGRILDRNGRAVAVNRDSYRVVIIAEQAGDVEATLAALGTLIPLDEADRRRILRDIRRRRSFVPVTVRENLSWHEVSAIEVNAPDLPGVMIDVGQTREYPYAEDLSHLVGYVAAVSEKELTGEPLLELPGFKIGKSGIEKAYDETLRGKAGASQVEVNAVGRVIRELSRQEGEPGNDVRLSLDLELQRLASERLREERSAAAVAMDIGTGEVLVMASSPGYDPNAFARGLTNEEWRALTSDPTAPLTNKTIAGQYAPGSTFKLVVAAAALESGVVGPDHRVFCGGVTTLGNARFHCWKRYGHGWLEMLDGIEQSCDLYFYDLAKRLGVDRIAAMARRFGLGESFDLEVPGEKSGLIPTRAWKRAVIGVPWQQGETLVAGIGQGFVLTTPLQLCVMCARIANNGKAVRPVLVGGGAAGTAARAAPAPIGVEPGTLAVLREGMYRVSNGAHGTARRARIDREGMEMGGKTGTSQVRRITKRERDTRVLKNEELPWKERDHALFVGFAPVQAPRFAVSVVVEHGGGGSAVAAPIARDLLLATQLRAGAWAGADAERGAPAVPGRG